MLFCFVEKLVKGERPWFANTDMVRYWHFLGVVRKHENKSRTRAVWVESERLEL